MKKKNKFASVVLIIVSAFLLLPLVITCIYSFVTGWVDIAPSGWTIDYYKMALSDARFWPSMARGLLISFVPIFITGVFIMLALYTSLLYYPWLEKYIQSLCMLPHTLKGVILAISVLSLYSGSSTIFGNRIVMLTCVYCIVISPYIYQGIRNNLHAINIHQLIEAAEILGASKLYAFARVIVPNMLSGIMVSALLAMSIIFSDFAVVKIIAGSQYITAQQLLYNSRNQPGQYSSVIVLVLFGITLIISGAAFAAKSRNSRNPAPTVTEE